MFIIQYFRSIWMPGIVSIVIVLSTTGCMLEPTEDITNEPLPISTTEETTSDLSNQNDESIDALIASYKELSMPPRIDTWLEISESFPDLSQFTNVEPTSPASVYGIGNEEYYYIEEQGITLAKHTELNAIMGVYENMNPSDIIESLTKRDLTMKQRTENVEPSSFDSLQTEIQTSEGEETVENNQSETQPPNTDGNADTAENATDPGDEIATVSPLGETHTYFSIDQFSHAEDLNMIIYVVFFDSTKDFPEQRQAYLSTFFNALHNNQVTWFLVPFSERESLGLPKQSITDTTLVVLQGKEPIAQYVGIYTYADMVREFVRLFYTHVVTE